MDIDKSYGYVIRKKEDYWVQETSILTVDKCRDHIKMELRRMGWQPPLTSKQEYNIMVIKEVS